MKTIPELKAERDRAWAAFNPQSPPSQYNDFVSLMLANLAWHRASGIEWGDSIDGVITRYSLWFRGKGSYESETESENGNEGGKGKKKKRSEKPPATVWSEQSASDKAA